MLKNSRKTHVVDENFEAARTKTDLDALREWMESDLDVIMVGTWMLCGNGWNLIWSYHGWHMDALREWMESDLDDI